MDMLQNQKLINGINAWLVDRWFALLAAILIGWLAYFIGRKVIHIVLKRAIKIGRGHLWHQKDIDKRQKTLEDLFVNIWRIVVFITLMYAILRVFVPDISTTLAPLFASAGIIGVALGFGAQSLIKDFLSGIFIISENQYRVGDIVEIEGFSGTVERIGSRSTMLRDVNGNVHFFPNGMVQHVINKTMGYSMARFTIGVHPDTDVDAVSELVDKIGLTLSKEDEWKHKILSPPAFVSVGEITGNSVEIIIAGKTQPSDQWSVIAEMRRQLLEEFEKRKIRLAILPIQQAAPATKKK
jgi:small conductance mechanosensitive channel